MISIVFLTARTPSGIAIELIRMGIKVFEVSAISEALRLCNTEDIDAVVVGADVADHGLAEVQARRIMLRLAPEATSKAIVWELSQLFPQITTNRG